MSERRARGSPDLAREIRSLHAAGLATRRQLAERFGYTVEGIRQILRRRCFKEA